jgi:DNA-binding MarR family transcriptional regulator
MEQQGSDLRTHTGYWLRRLSDIVHVSFERQLAEHGVTVAQWNVLVTIYRRRARTTSEVARYTANDAAAVSRLVDRLVAKGLLTRSPDPTSRRKVLLALTPEAHELLPALIAIADRNDERFFGSMDPKRRAGLNALLEQLTNQTKENSHE